jgi:hypothetical protein
MECGLAGWGVVRLPWSEIPQWRRNPGPAPGLTPAPHLKLADEQTVVGCAALLNACARNVWVPDRFTDWAILAAPTYIGRVRMALGLHRFQKNGARGVSPLIIPTLSNHSMAGTLCLILGSHGPNLGVGGSTPLVDELFLNALSLCDIERCPGVWAIMTGWRPEPILGDDGQCSTPAVGVGVALALVLHAATGSLRVTAGRSPSQARGTVFELADFLEHASPGACWHAPILGEGQLEVAPDTAATSQRAA